MAEKQQKSKLGLGIALIMVGLMLLLPKSGQYNSNSSFENEPIEISGFSNSEVDGKNKPVRIVVPELSIDLSVDEAQIIDGYWEVFGDRAGWGEGSGVPGEIGNQVIFAHAREGLFLPLKDIESDMVVYVFTKDGWYSYKVVEIREVYPNQKEVIESTDNEVLTLYTCSGFQDTKRLVVAAKRI